MHKIAQHTYNDVAIYSRSKCSFGYTEMCDGCGNFKIFFVNPLIPSVPYMTQLSIILILI